MQIRGPHFQTSEAGPKLETVTVKTVLQCNTQEQQLLS